MLWNLTPEEELVVAQKATEPPFTGRYTDNFKDGVYRCVRCHRPLYLSCHKFPCNCGWCAFDQSIAGAVAQFPDIDGIRTEIECKNCKGHLGHLFKGENLTPKNLRHCVNSLSLDFLDRSLMERAIFAGGCFWGLQSLLDELDGVLQTTCGYCGGLTENPTYQEVCSGTTGHLESVEVFFDPRELSYRDLCRYFLEIHDPTQKGGQGPDLGDQYRSAVFALDKGQRAAAEDLLAKLREKGLAPVTEIKDEGPFWPAEDYHQSYYAKTGKAPYCHRWVKRF